MIRAIVAAAKLSSPEAAELLSRVIIERCDKVVKHWIAGVNRSISSKCEAAITGRFCCWTTPRFATV
jgi:hypothetical protein